MSLHGSPSTGESDKMPEFIANCEFPRENHPDESGSVEREMVLRGIPNVIAGMRHTFLRVVREILRNFSVFLAVRVTGKLTRKWIRNLLLPQPREAL